MSRGRNVLVYVPGFSRKSHDATVAGFRQTFFGFVRRIMNGDWASLTHCCLFGMPALFQA